MKTNPKFQLSNIIDEYTELSEIELDALELPLYERIYFYGEHFKIQKQNSLKYLIKALAAELIELLESIVRKNIKSNKPKVLTANNLNYDIMLENLGYQVERCLWSRRRKIKTAGSISLKLLFLKINYRIIFWSFRRLISPNNINLLNQFKENLKKNIIDHGYVALFISNDVSFFNRLSIEVFNELKLPVIMLAHGGMPTVYDGGVDQRADMVSHWGSKQREGYYKNYKKKDTKHILINPNFYEVKKHDLTFSLDNILVCSNSANGVQIGDIKGVEDRMFCLKYLFSIKRVLEKLNVNKVRFRPHPSEDPRWYYNYIDPNFFVYDDQSLDVSLKLSTLVIGPISTVFVDSLIANVVYVIYEPLNDMNETGFGMKLTAPIDGNDPRIPLVISEKELFGFLDSDNKIDKDLINDFATHHNELHKLKNFIDVQFYEELK